MSRVFCDNLSGNTVRIAEAEAHHLLHVLRAKAGDEICLFDGRGQTAVAEIESCSRRELICRIRDRTVFPKPQRPAITVAVAPPKGDRLKWMVEKLTELGVDRLALMETERSVAAPSETRTEKLQAGMLAACRQCRRNWSMEIQPLRPFADVLLHAANTSLRIAHPGIGQVQPTHSDRQKDMSDIVLLVGPEGGFAPAEVTAAMAAGAVGIEWAETILRIETAALVFASLLMSRLHVCKT